MKISAAIITYNEERNIARVLESLRCCDEIVVIDSGSNDRTVELATKLGARVVDTVWRGWILHSGWYPDRKIRLYDRRHAKWVGDYVHESVVVEGTIGHLKSNILHFTCSSLSEHLKTMDRYTTLAAEQLVEQKKEIGWKQLALDPPWTFFKTYVLQRGFLDGTEGLAIAHMAALYNFVKYAKAKNMSPRR
jgi:glycosyltransferase involved in cell wall biosynthesis